MCSRRMQADRIDTHDDKIDNDIFRELTIELLNKYPIN